MSKVTDAEVILKDVLTRPRVPLWPHAGFVLNLGRTATFAAFRAGLIEGEQVGKKINVNTAPLRRRVGLDEQAA